MAKIGVRVLDLRKIHYGPKGCSKSIIMEKVLLRKRLLHKRSATEDIED